MKSARWIMLGCCAAALLTAQTAAWAEDEIPSGDVKIVVNGVEIEKGDDAKRNWRWSTQSFPVPRGQTIFGNNTITLTAPTSANYLLGVALSPVGESLAAQLKLEPGHGMVVGETVEGSAAAKAGIKTHDVLIRVGDVDVKGQQGIAEALNKSEGKEIVFKLIRAGKAQVIKVAPRKLPEPKAVGAQATRADIDVVRRFFDAQDGNQAFRMQVMGPGFVVGKAKSLPDGVTIRITHAGDKPTQIDVTRGDENWSINPDQLEKLPEELRVPVASRLGPQGFRWRASSHAVPAVQAGNLPRVQIVRPRERQQRDLNPQDRLDARLREVEQTMKQTKELMKQIEQTMKDARSEMEKKR